MGFSRCDSIFSLALPFPGSFDEMGSLMRFVGDGRIGFEAEWGGSPNWKTHGGSGPWTKLRMHKATGLLTPELDYGLR